MINKVILVGNLGADPEVRYAQNGSAVANLSVATSENWTDKNTGQKQEKTEWHRVVIFGKLAEIAAQYLVKGSQVYLEGKIQTRKWQDKNTGQDRYATEIVLDFNGVMQMLGGKPQQGEYQQQGGYQQPQQAQQMQQSMQQQRPQQQAQQRPQQGGNMTYPNPAHQPQPPQYMPNDFDDMDVPF